MLLCKTFCKTRCEDSKSMSKCTITSLGTLCTPFTLKQRGRGGEERGRREGREGGRRGRRKGSSGWWGRGALFWGKGRRAD